MDRHIFNEFGQDRIIIYNIDASDSFETPIKLHNYHLFMLEDGEMTVDVNHRIFNMKPMSSIHLSAGDIIRGIRFSNDIKGKHLVFSPEFQNEIRTTRKSPISIQLKKEFPYQEFSKEDYLTYMDLAGINVSYFRPTAAEGELVNVFPKADTTFAGYVDKTGAEKEKADYRTSALIPVNEGDIIYFAGCALDQTYQLVTYDASGAPAEEATTLNYVSRYVDLGDGYGICAYKARPGTAGVRIVAPTATYEAGKVLVTVNQPITLDAYNAFLSTIPETEPIPETTAVPEPAPAPETTEAPAPETTEAPAVTEEPTEAVEQTEAPAPEQTTAPATAEKGCGGMISGAVAVIALLGTAIVFKRKKTN
jgi:hypothetical protein